MNQDAAGVAVADLASGDDDDDDVDANGAGGPISKIHDGRAFLDHFLPFFALCDRINHVESLGVLTGSTAYS